MKDVRASVQTVATSAYEGLRSINDVSALASLCALVIALAVIWSGYVQVVHSVQKSEQAYESRRQLYTALKLLLDQETGIRGYTSTGDRTFLEPYNKARPIFELQLQRLGDDLEAANLRATSDDVQALRSDYSRWLHTVAQPLAQREPSKQSIALQRRGKRLMDAMRTDIASLLAQVDTATKQEHEEGLGRLRMMTVIASVIIVLVFGSATLMDLSRRAAQAERQRYFNMASDMICVANFDGILLRVNPAWERTLGYSQAELIKRPFMDFVHPDDVENTVNVMKVLRDNQPVSGFRNRYRAKDGSYHWLVWSATPNQSRRLMYASARDETERVRFESQLERLSYRDSLTGLANRRAFLEQLASVLAAAKRYHQSFSILYVDLDNFKALNDSRGHQAGDNALQEIAGGLTAALRESDFVARLGGDEFAVLLPPVADSHDNVIIAQRIRTTVSEICLRLVSASGCWDFGASIGVAVYPGDGATADELMHAADRAMYRVKNAGELLV